MGVDGLDLGQAGRHGLPKLLKGRSGRQGGAVPSYPRVEGVQPLDAGEVSFVDGADVAQDPALGDGVGLLAVCSLSFAVAELGGRADLTLLRSDMAAGGG
jgi:hypothetical protein